MANKYEVVALDIFGTVLSSTDADNEMPPRRGINEFLENCNKKNIYVVGASDANPTTTKRLLSETGVLVDLINRFYQLNQLPIKDFSIILRDMGVKHSNNLLVIRDNYDKDIMGAVEYGCSFLQVPEYRDNLDDFDFRKIKI